MVQNLLVARQFGGAPPPQRSPEYLAENVGPRLLAVVITLYILSTSTVLLRFYVRIFMLKTFGWDDWMMAMSATLSTACLGLFVLVVNLGLGLHAEAFPIANLTPFFKIMFFYSIFVIFAYSFIKLSIGFFLLRLADRTKWRPFLIGMLIFLSIFTIGSTFAIIFQCFPVQAAWDNTLRPPTGTAKCYDFTIFKNVGVFNSCINIATDLLFALIPIPMVWRLQVNRRTRIGLAIILSLGLFASAVAIYKTPMQYNFLKETDWSGKGSWYYIWQQVEMHVGILAACLPTLKPLFANFFGQLRTLTKGRSTGSNGVITPFRSSGYVKHSAGQDQDSFRMKNLSQRSRSQLHSRDPYYEDDLLEKDLYGVVAMPEGRTRGLSRTADSEEELFSREVRRLSTVPRGMAIVKTTEVNISR